MVRKRLEIQEDLQQRVYIFRFIVVVALLLIVSRLWFLQVILGSSYNQMAQTNRVRERSIEAIRGNIYDRNKKLLVTSRPALAITVVPYVFNDKAKVKKRLSKLIGTPVKEIEKRMNDKRSAPLQPKVIKRSVNQKIVYYIKERPVDFEGVRVEMRPERDYLYGPLAAHLFGYVGEVSDIELKKGHFKDVEMGDTVGKTGLENYYNSALMGVKGQERIETNASGRPVRILKRKKPRAGSSIMLSLDLKIQKAAEDALKKAIKAASGMVNKETKKAYKPKGGAVVVMDPRNGDVLAMASYPTFNPSSFLGGIKMKEWKALTNPKNNFPMNNRVATSAYPPGSTFKPFVSIAGLQSKVINTNTSFTCSGTWKGSDKWPNQFRCWKKTGHGPSNLHRGLQVSCDVYYYNVGYGIYKTGGEHIQKWASLFGFGSKTGITLPYEEGGRIPTKRWKRWLNRAPGMEQYRAWYPGDTVNLSIGQGDTLVTPIQMASAISAIANGGTLYKPRLVKGFMSSDGDIRKELPPEKIRKLNVSPAYFQAVRDGMKAVTNGEGTASAAFGGFPISVAAKTGTAEVKGKQTTALFVSFAPADKPKYVTVMIVEEGGHGGSTGAPATRDMYSKIFNVKEKTDKKAKKGPGGAGGVISD